jgi:hypothetical protein
MPDYAGFMCSRITCYSFIGVSFAARGGFTKGSSPMADHFCPCCAWTNIVPNHTDDVFVSCPECGQVLLAPAPWSSAGISNCDTRRMIAWPRDASDLSAWAGVVLVPWELTCQLGQVAQLTPGSIIRTALAVLAMGTLFLIVNLWAPPGNFLRWLGPLVGLLALLLGAVSLCHGIRKTRRRTRARVLRLAEPLPAEACQLGSPVALHQVRMFWRLAYVSTGFLLGIVGGVCATMAMSGQVHDHRIFEIAFVGCLVGPCLIWRAMSRQGKRILAFTNGVIIFDKGRAVACRWDQIEELWLKPKETTGETIQHFTLTLCRDDGEKLVVTSDTEFIENQLAVRIQYQHCACILPSLQRVLDGGSTLDFGPLQVGADGIHWNGHILAWNEIRASLLNKGKLTIVGDNDCNGSFNIGAVPNLTILLGLIRQRARTSAPSANPSTARP